MDAREYLSLIKTLDFKCRMLEEEVNELVDLSRRAGALDYSKERIQVGSEIKEPAFIKALDKADDKVEKAREMIQEFADYRDNCRRQLQMLSDGMDVDIIYQKFFQYKKFEQIADEMHLSFNAIRYHYRKGLDEFDRRKLWEA